MNTKHPLEGNDSLLQALLEPAQTTVKMSWLIWRGDGMIVDIGETLRDLEHRLNDALSMYHGQFRKPAFHLLAHVHEMLGKLAVERTVLQGI